MVDRGLRNLALKEIFLFRWFCILIVKRVVNIWTLVHHSAVRSLFFGYSFLFLPIYISQRRKRRWYLSLNCWNYISIISVHKIECFVPFILIVLGKPRIIVILCNCSAIQLFIFCFFMPPKMIGDFNLFWFVLLQIFSNYWG